MAEFYQLPSSAVQNHRTNKTVPAIRYFPRKTGQCLNLHLHKAHQGTAPCCPICWGKKTLNKAGQLPAAQPLNSPHRELSLGHRHWGRAWCSSAAPAALLPLSTGSGAKKQTQSTSCHGHRPCEILLCLMQVAGFPMKHSSGNHLHPNTLPSICQLHEAEKTACAAFVFSCDPCSVLAVTRQKTERQMGAAEHCSTTWTAWILGAFNPPSPPSFFWSRQGRNKENRVKLWKTFSGRKRSESLEAAEGLFSHVELEYKCHF